MSDNEKLVLIDEEGNEVEASCIDYIELDEKEYVVFSFNEEIEEYDEVEDSEDNEFEEVEENEEIELDEEDIIIMRVEKDKDKDEYIYVGIDDEDEFNRVFEEFQFRCGDEYEIIGHD